MFVNHVSSSSKTDLNGRFVGGLAMCLRPPVPNSELRASSVTVPTGRAAKEFDVVRHGVTVVTDQAHCVVDLVVGHVEQPGPARHLQRVGEVDVGVRRALERWGAVIGVHGITDDVWIPEISADHPADLRLATQ
jgi:hypothetical protein